jgi:hypothetical protein
LIQSLLLLVLVQTDRLDFISKQKASSKKNQNKKAYLQTDTPFVDCIEKSYTKKMP